MMINDSAGKLILRLALGILILLHGLAKARSGVGGIASMLTQLGLPSLLAYGVYVGEIVAPLMVITGWLARLGAALIAINMVFALMLAHRSEFTDFASSGGWALELQAMYLFTAVAVALLGPGRYSINQRGASPRTARTSWR
jgi:putative oxidoreductase